jgi:glycosyltransferase involved in cell wall biosynthesis
MRLLIVNDNTLDAMNGVVTTFQNVLSCLQQDHAHVQVKYLSPQDFKHIKGVGYPDLSIPLDLWQLADQVDAFGPTHVHLGTEGVLGMAAKFLFDSRHWAYTSSLHTRWDMFAKQALGFELWGCQSLMRYFHKNSAAVLVTTPGMATEAHELGIDRTVVWSRGVNVHQFPFRDHAPGSPLRLLTVGRVSAEKRMERFCELNPHMYDLTLVGDGPQLAELKATHPHVKFTGALKGDALAEAYAQTDVFVFTSESDTFGLVMLESMACGTPVAALPVRGPLDVIEPGVTGFMHEDLNVAIQSCVTLDRHRVHEATKKFSWHAVTKKFLDTLVSIT